MSLCKDALRRCGFKDSDEASLRRAIREIVGSGDGKLTQDEINKIVILLGAATQIKKQ